MKKLQTLAMCAGLALGATTASRASAQNVTITDVETGNDDLGNVLVPGYGSPWTTPILLKDTAGKVYVVFCDDLDHVVNVGGGQLLPYHIGYVTTDGLGRTISEDVSNKIGQLADLGRSDYYKHDETGAIAAQAAIWGIEYDLSVTASMIGSTLDQMIQTDIAIANNGRGYALGLIPNANYHQQSQIIGGAPEPDTWALMLFGVGALGIALRRSRRRQVLGTA